MKHLLPILLALTAYGATAQTCITRHALTHQYDLLDERICYDAQREVDWNISSPKILDVSQWTGDVLTTPMLPIVRVLLSDEQYTEIKEVYDTYKDAIKGLRSDAAAEERELYVLIVNDIIDGV